MTEKDQPDPEDASSAEDSATAQQGPERPDLTGVMKPFTKSRDPEDVETKSAD